MKAIVTGGYFDEVGDGALWLVDFDTERADKFFGWTPPEGLRVPGKGFAGGSLGGGRRLFVAAHAAVVEISLDLLSVASVFHQPCMNDLHHVSVIGDGLYVANTGFGSVDVLSLTGGFMGSHALIPGWANARRMAGESLPEGLHRWNVPDYSSPTQSWQEPENRDAYYTKASEQLPFHLRKVPDFLHVNHVTKSNSRLIATCFTDGSLRDLASFEVLRTFGGKFIHDGAVWNDSLLVTTTDGWVIELDATDFSEIRRTNVFSTGHYGWCRGLAAFDKFLAVGLTEVREPKVPRFRWCDLPPSGSETSVLLLDRFSGRCCSRVDLSDPSRHSKIYSVIPIDEAS